MNETNKLKLKKPAQNDFYNIDDFNYNSDIIDEEIDKIHKHIDAINPDAGSITYDNMVSGLKAVNVKEAIDEVNTKNEANKTSISKLDSEIKETNKNLKNLGDDFNGLNSESNNWQKYKVTEDNGRCKSSSNQDANNITLGGCYNGVDMLHMPNDSKEWWYLEVISHSSSGYCYQVATQLTAEAPKKYHRNQINGIWNQWRSL